MAGFDDLIPQAAPGDGVFADLVPDIDTRTGAPARVRMAVGAASTPADRLATLRRFAPDARPYQNDNFLFTNPATGRVTVYNPRGPDWGDLPSLLPEAGETLGGIVGGALVVPPAVAGIPISGGASALAVPAGVGLGAAAGRELATGIASSLGDTVDTRSLPRRLVDAGTTAAVNAAAVPVGEMIGRGVRSLFGARGTGGAPAVQDFRQAGVEPSAGAVTGNRATQLLERGLENTPGGVGPIREQAERQAAQMGDEARRIAGGYSPGPHGRAEAGHVLRQGAEAAVERFTERQGQLYDAAYAAVGRDTPAQFPAVQRLAQDLATDVAQAPASRTRVLRPALQRIEALLEDAGANGGNVPFEALRRIRTDIGRELDPRNPAAAVGSDSRLYLERLYAALSEDMTATARSAGGDAERLLATADRYTRFNRSQNMPGLERILSRGTDAEVYNLVFPTSGRPDAQALARVRRNMQPEEWNTLAATVIDRMGMPVPGRQAGEDFSVNTFLTNWNKLRQDGPAARNVLFGGGGQNAQLAAELDRLGRVAERLRDVDRMANPSGTARNMIAGAGLLSMGERAMAGDLAGAGAIGFMGMIAPNAAARLMTSPRFVAWLADAAPTYARSPELSSRLVPRLTAIATAEPELRDAVEAYRNVFLSSAAPQRR